MPDSGCDMVGNTDYFAVSPRPGEALGDYPRGQTLVEHYNAHYGRYIDLADQLRTFGLEKEIPLPQVVVIGIQSSGKSSVLESISGVPLPRGTGRWRCRCVLLVVGSDVTVMQRNKVEMDKESFCLSTVQYFCICIFYYII